MGNVATGGTYYQDSTVKYGVGCTAFVGQMIDFNYWMGYLTTLSTRIQSLQVTGTTTAQYGGVILTGTLSHHQEVFNVRGVDLCNANYFQINNIDGFASIFINVDGNNLNCGRMGMSGYNASNVVFNFYAATTLTFQSVSWMGSVLAPYANIWNPTGNMYGQVYANSWISNATSCMQQNWNPFVGCISDCYWSKANPMCTYSEATWGQQSGSVATVLNTDFSLAFPVGIQIGCNSNLLLLSSPITIRAFLPQTGAAVGVLDNIYVDVTTTPAGDFAGQLVALGLGIGIDAADPAFSPACGFLKDIYLCNSSTLAPCAAFNGQTIQQIYYAANQIIGQCSTSGISVNAAYTCVQFINTQFSGCQTWTNATYANMQFCSCGTNECANTPDYVVAAMYAAEKSTGAPVEESSAMVVVPFLLSVLAALFV